MRWLLGAFFALLVSTAVLAVEADEMLKDPALEARARALSRTLRCMVCQNESIDDSHAPLARDIRVLVRERIAAGDSDVAVRDFLVARYGEFILLEPRFRPATILLWGMPILVLVAAVTIVGVAITRRGRSADKPLSAAEKRRLSALLEENNRT
jgi:cytochrome c-type biogenesis protein CcmH